MYADGYNQSENEIDITKQVASGFSNLLASNQDVYKRQTIY